jgi:hypothetical protein
LPSRVANLNVFVNTRGHKKAIFFAILSDKAKMYLLVTEQTYKMNELTETPDLFLASGI